MRRHIFGPGLLLAGASIGVSHRVQSTPRAGAVDGLGRMALVILANLFKSPAYRFGPQCAARLGRGLAALAGLNAAPRFATTSDETEVSFIE